MRAVVIVSIIIVILVTWRQLSELRNHSCRQLPAGCSLASASAASLVDWWWLTLDAAAAGRCYTWSHRPCTYTTTRWLRVVDGYTVKSAMTCTIFFLVSLSTRTPGTHMGYVSYKYNCSCCDQTNASSPSPGPETVLRRFQFSPWSADLTSFVSVKPSIVVDKLPLYKCLHLIHYWLL